MPNLPIRGLGAVGVVTDADPYNLPIEGYTRAKNVRFTEGKVTHGPIYRDILTVDTNNSTDPVFVRGLFNVAGYDTVIYVDNLFNVRELTNLADASVYDSSDTVGQDESALKITSTTLANVEYINRSDRAPLSRVPGSTSFTVLPNWPNDASDKKFTTTSLRSFGDFLLALGTNETVSGAASSYPNRVRFSDLTLANNVPGSWDDTAATTSAGFTDLVQMSTPIVDGATLGSNFLVYSSDQVWGMEYVGGTFIFNFRKLFDDAGVISQNCIVEVEGQHYVFDRDDIYRTDGLTRQSICEGRIRDYVFNAIDMSKSDACFVQHNSELEEIYFCYHSGDDMALYTEGDFCNRAAVYNYRNDTWSFQDLPNVISGSTSNFDTTEDYGSIATAGFTYSNIGGTYQSQESAFNRHPFMLSRGATNDPSTVASNKLLGIDMADTGTMTKPIETTLTTNAVVERVGIDLDEQGIPLSGYKVISRIYPQISSPNSDGTFNFTFGAAETPNGTPNYAATQTFDVLADYKLDSRMSGRYLSYKLESDDPKNFAFTGMDLDVQVTGRR